MRSKEAIRFIINKLREELPGYLEYHSVEHTLEVIENAEAIATHEGVTGRDLALVRTAAAFHDSGMLKNYTDHEAHSCRVARLYLPRFDFTKEDIKQIESLIMSTKVSHSPKSLLQKILCDADLSYLGCPNYHFTAGKLQNELQHAGYDLSGERWLKFQISFLRNHKYYTNFALTHLQEQKEEVLAHLEKKLHVSKLGKVSSLSPRVKNLK